LVCFIHIQAKGPEGLSTLDLQSCIFTDKPHLGGVRWTYVAEDEDNIKLDYTNASFCSMEQTTPTWAQAFFERYDVDPKECAQARYDKNLEEVTLQLKGESIKAKNTQPEAHTTFRGYNAEIFEGSIGAPCEAQK
ncbi:hypothetical protein Pmar_PMAR025203, partial [Perkinsus marinus ATCC 50983]